MSYIDLLNEIKAKAFEVNRNPRDIHLVAVSKGQSIESIKKVYDQGCRDFGENRVIELLEKKKQLPEDIRWHFIGTLQKNKVNKLLGNSFLIHSVDSLSLAKLIGEKSLKKAIVSKILLQVNTSFESAKHGYFPNIWMEKFLELKKISGIQIVGLMTMAPLTDKALVIKSCFQSLKKLREKLAQTLSVKEENLHLSMGMTNDYLIAIEEGATYLRIGRKIFQNT